MERTSCFETFSKILPSAVGLVNGGGFAGGGHHAAGAVVPAQRSALCALRLPGPAAADCAQRPAGGPCTAGFCLFIPKCVLRRGNHEFSRVRPVHRQPDQDRGSGRAGFSPGLCSSQRGGAGHEQLHHLLPSGGHRGSGGHHGAAGDSGRFHRRTALPPGAAAGLAGAASGMRRQYRSVGGADCHGLRLQRSLQFLPGVQRLLYPLRVQ